jgi:Glycosyltransferase family 87
MTSRTLKFAIAAVLTLALMAVLAHYASRIQSKLAQRDSIAYWSAATLMIHHSDPYNSASVLDLERKYGYENTRPLVLRTPPWSLFMVLPLAFLSPFWAWVTWLAVLVFCLMAGLRLSRRVYALDDMPANALTIVAYLFAPVAACVVAGQMGLVLMLGVVLFLYLEKDHPFFAGAALIFPLAKPHLLSLFWIAFVLWVGLRRKSRVASGLACAFVIANLTALAFDPHVFAHYHGMLVQQNISYEFIPALSGMLRLFFFRSYFWAQFVPMAIGVGWSLLYIRANWSTWNWREHGPALLVVSVFVTPYEWISDEAVLLPAILQAVVFVYAGRNVLRLGSKLAFFAFALLDMVLLLILRAQVPFSTGIYFWSSLVWCGWYFYARRVYRRLLKSGIHAAVAAQTVS